MPRRARSRGALIAIAVATLSAAAAAQQAPPRFGGSYATLDQRQQQFVVDWVGRFSEITGRRVEPGEFYDDIVSTLFRAGSGRGPLRVTAQDSSVTPVVVSRTYAARLRTSPSSSIGGPRTSSAWCPPIPRSR